MVVKRPEDAFMALLTSYHSRQFCRAAFGARARAAASSRFSTSALLAASQREIRRKERIFDFSQGAKIPENIAIIGSGITGLTTAHYLAKWLPPTSRITIFDSAERTGGWINTETHKPVVDGRQYTVRLERGPRTLRGMGKDTWKFHDFVLGDLLKDLDMMDQYKGIPSPPRYIYHRDRLVSLEPHKILYDPIFKGAFAGLLTALFRRFKACREPYPSEDMSISEFVKFATGRPELTDNLVSAMLHGIWGGDADKLSMASAMPAQYWRFFSRHMEGHLKVAEYELGAFLSLRRDRKLREFLKDTQKDRLVFFKDGLSSLPNAIERGLRERENVTFELGNPIVNLRYDSKKERALATARNSGENLPFDKVVCTTTSKVLYQMTRGAIPSLADSPNVSIIAVNLWYPNPFLKNEQGVGYLVPRSAKNNPEHLLGVFFDSDVVPLARGEDVGTKLFVLMGGHHYDKLAKPPTQEEGIEMAKAAVERHLGIPRDEPCFAVAQYAKDCIPQHHVGHWKRMGMAEAEIDYAFKGSLAVAGGSYTSIGVMGGLHAGFEVAQHIALSAKETVGDTGLGQFQSSLPSMPYYQREQLVLAGRDIAPQEHWFQKLFG